MGLAFQFMRIYTSLFIAVFTVCYSTIQAQHVPGLPVQFTQFFKTYTLINPAGMGKDSSMEFNVGNKSLTGAFNGVRTFYAFGNIQLNKRNSHGVKHVLGLSFINDKEGNYINRNRASIMYAFHLPVSQRTTISAGVALGMVNYFFKASNISAGGSAFAPNADVGLWLHRENFNIGISSNQIIESQLTPIDQTYSLDRHYNLIVDKIFYISPFVSITPAMVFRWYSQDFYTVDVGLVTLLQQKISFAATYKYERGFSFSGGLENIILGQSIFKTMFSYFTPAGGAQYYNPVSYEISVGFIPSRSRPYITE